MTTALESAEHTHNASAHAHAHAFATLRHDHMLRAVCGRDECRNFPTHNIHAGPAS